MALPIPIGTWRVVWFGSSGPYYYDDGVDADDKELLYDGVAAPPQSAFITDGQIDIASAPTLDPHVLRLVDVGVLVGDVIGPASSTDHAVVRWDGATGKLVQDSSVTIDDTGNVTLPNSKYLRIKDASGTARNVIGLTVGDDISIGGDIDDILFSPGGKANAVKILQTSGYVGINATPLSLLHLGFGTEDLEFVDAGSTGATEQDWVEVEVGGNTGYIRVYAAK